MIYLHNTIEPQDFFVPKSREASGRVRMTLPSVELNICEESYPVLLHHLSVELPTGMKDGEYEYTLMDEIGELSQGILVVGTIERPKEYDNTITYEQY